jgi:4-alpha-glucanotransferase
MKINFKIHYRTEWGQQLAITGNLPPFGNDAPGKALVLNYQGDGYWGGSIEVPEPPSSLEYRYLIIDEPRGTRRLEANPIRHLDLSKEKADSVLLKDTWRLREHDEEALYTSAFLDVILRPAAFKSKIPAGAGDHPVIRFRMRAPQVRSGYQLCIVGNIEELGNWDPQKPLLLGNESHPVWTGAVTLKSGLTVEYKYGIYDPEGKKLVHLEDGDNRILPASWIMESKRLLIADEYLRHPAGKWRGAGVAIPVFSLRSHRGLGVGEFPDLKLMVDWARKVGLNMVQILPVNDTSATHTWTDSYPYAAISVFALHPLYLNVDAMGMELSGTEERTLLEEREALNKLDKVDYEAVTKLKLKLARQVFDNTKDEWLKDKAFKRFFKETKHWLRPYAAFCYLRDKYGTVDFNQWEAYADYSGKKLDKLTDPKADHYEEVAFHYFLQYHLDRQLQEAARYARENGVILKGDIPIGIYRYSVDAWVAPHLYNMDGQAGAPPDPFSDTGQNWGFPTYNWKEMAKDGFQWWQQRLRQLSRYFDAFRIDHILGFFRIWEIPFEQIEGLMGYFKPAIPVHRDEFHQRGIPFHRDRYCLPYIPEQYLYELFRQDADYVKKTFLETDRPYLYRMKPAFDTQRKVEHYLNLEENADKVYLKPGLFELISNVLFFEEKGSVRQSFHPRIKMMDTRSFQDLDPETQQKLEELYIDYFYRRQEDFWRQRAMEKLPAIKEATNMLICGEDLGMVPACVPGVMRELGILSLEIQRMSKNPRTEFLHPSDIPYLSVCSPSTHDMSPIRAWWEEMEADQRQRFFNLELGIHGEAPFYCEPNIVERILQEHLTWPSMWAVFPIQDIAAIDGQLRRKDPFEERINIPANPKHYWRYRFHLHMEELLKKDAFNNYFRYMVRNAGRAKRQKGKKAKRQ